MALKLAGLRGESSGSLGGNMLNVLPLLRVHVTAYFCICSEQHFKVFSIILVKVEHDRARLLPRNKITRAREVG